MIAPSSIRESDANGLLEYVEQPRDDLVRRRPFDGTAGRRAHQEGFAKRPGQPMGLAASGQLIDRYAAVFLPDARGRDCRFVGGISRQSVANLTPAADQAIRWDR